MEVNYRTTTQMVVLLVLLLSSAIPSSLAYRPGDIVPMSRMGQYHATRTVWHDMIGRHCPIFAVNREALIPIPKPTGYTGADPYKISFQVGREKFYVPWLFVINRKSSEVPMIEMNLRYSGADLLGVTAKVVDMPNSCRSDETLGKHQMSRGGNGAGPEPGPPTSGRTCNPPRPTPLLNLPGRVMIILVDMMVEHFAEYIVLINREEQSEIDVASGFYVLFGSGLMLSFVLAIYVLQSSHDKLSRTEAFGLVIRYMVRVDHFVANFRFVKETVAETNMPAGGVAKVE
ncbi:UNVERIFIED_CONTAM: hypothetical protein Slati_1648600 [Sesamum latifolium]|uniref:Uncharacterized protein n=1 Tax=Sesamum latifolium TaxID=2727402 RepID=A0AAW2XAB1_9LAMI